MEKEVFEIFEDFTKLKNRKDWDEWCKQNLKSKTKDISIVPNLAYKNNGWVSFKDWLDY